MDMKEEYNFASSSSKWRKYDSRKCAINCDEKHFIDSSRDSLEKISGKLSFFYHFKISYKLSFSIIL